MWFRLDRWIATVDSRVIDAVLAVSLAGVSCVIGSAYHVPPWSAFDLRAYLLTCLVSLPLAAWRRYPIVVLVMSNVAFATYIYLDYQPSMNFWGPIIALFFVAASRQRAAVLVATLVTAATTFYSGMAADLPPIVAIAQAVLVPPVAVGIGSATRRLGERNALLATLTAQLQAQQQERAHQAVMEDRVRIARELHDVIAHHMSLISIQAGLARYVISSDPATANSALTTISDTSREALAEMRRMLALLRVGPDRLDDGPQVGDGPAETVDDPAPGLDRLDALIDRVRAAGLTVRLDLQGEPRALNPGAALCVYRVIQESLTNVLTHASPATATVTLVYRADGVLVNVTDDGKRPAAVAATPQDGRVRHGLSGMRERARLYSGTLAAGPRPEGGFAVELTLPVSALLVPTPDTVAGTDPATAPTQSIPAQ